MKTRKKYFFITTLFSILILYGILNKSLNSNADTNLGEFNSNYILDNANATSTKTLSELEVAFRNSSSNYRKIELNYENEALNYYIYEQQWNEIDKQIGDICTAISDYIMQRDEFIKAGDTVNAQLSQGYIDQYRAEVDRLTLSQLESKLNKDIYQFYKDNKINLIREAQKNLEIDFKKKCLSLVTLNEQIEYYQSTEQYIKALLHIENTKYKKGYSTKTDMDDLEAQLANISAQAIQLENTYQQILSDIKIETSIYEDFNINLETEIRKATYTYDTVSSLFANRYFEITRLIKLREYYQEYVQQLKDIYGTNSPYVAQIELKIQELSLDAHISNNTINMLAREAVDAYYYSYEAIKAKELSVAVANQKYKETSKQYEKGKLARIDLLNAEMEREKIEVEYYKLYYDFIIWDEIITNIVPGQRP